MTIVKIHQNEHIDSALRRFKTKVIQADIFNDIQKNRHFETCFQKHKRKKLVRNKQSRSLQNKKRFISKDRYI